MSEAPARDPKERSDDARILSGTAQNIAGIGIAALAMFVVQILMTRTLGRQGFGVVTIVTQGAFVISFVTRGGMDMAVLRDVAANVGVGRHNLNRVTVVRAAMAAGGISIIVAFIVAALADPIARAANVDAAGAIRAGALGIPFLALSSVWLAATRGLKIMRYTLYVFWAGQNLIWIVLTVLLWRFSTSAEASILAYSLSWAWAALASWWFWRRESRIWDAAPPEPGMMSRIARYAAPRAPAALFAQLLFWSDLFVVTQFVTDEAVGVYGAALRAGQLAMLFLTSVNLMFAPFVADLYNRGERDELDRLYKNLTRWLLAATLPVFVVVAIAPGEVMRIFGAEFGAGSTALLILLAGQLINVATGSAGFILIMVGRTGWDFAIYAGSVALNVVLAILLCPTMGIEGAAIANAVTFTVSNLARLAAVRYFVRIQPYDRRYARLVVPVAFATGAALLAHRIVSAGYLLELSAVAGAGLLAYAIAYVLVGLTPAERRKGAALLARGTG